MFERLETARDVDLVTTASKSILILMIVSMQTLTPYQKPDTPREPKLLHPSLKIRQVLPSDRRRGYLETFHLYYGGQIEHV